MHTGQLQFSFNGDAFPPVCAKVEFLRRRNEFSSDKEEKTLNEEGDDAKTGFGGEQTTIWMMAWSAPCCVTL